MAAAPRQAASGMVELDDLPKPTPVERDGAAMERGFEECDRLSRLKQQIAARLSETAGPKPPSNSKTP